MLQLKLEINEIALLITKFEFPQTGRIISAIYNHLLYQFEAAVDSLTSFLVPFCSS